MKSIKVQEPWQRAIVILQYRFIVHTSGNARTSEENTLDCQRSLCMLASFEREHIVSRV